VEEKSFAFLCRGRRVRQRWINLSDIRKGNRVRGFGKRIGEGGYER
jgi:hypothetical protein